MISCLLNQGNFSNHFFFQNRFMSGWLMYRCIFHFITIWFCPSSFLELFFFYFTQLLLLFLSFLLLICKTNCLKLQHYCFKWFFFTTTFAASFLCFLVAIFLGSFRMPYHEIRQMIVEVDEEQLTEPMIQVGQVLHKVVKMQRASGSYLTLVHGLTTKLRFRCPTVAMRWK